MPGDCIVVYFLKPQPPGYEFARTRDDWPLHITLVPWFGNVAVEDIRAALQKCAEAVKPFTLVLGEDRWFNPDTQVTIAKDTRDIGLLHTSLLNCVESAGATLRVDRWIRGLYKAHVTHHENDTRPKEGDTYKVESFSLVTLISSKRCKVMHTFRPGAGRETAA